MNGESFSTFVYDELHKCFETLNADSPWMFLMDNDPSQTSKVAIDSIDDIGAELFTIPPRSPDVNVIENLFNVFKRQLDNDAISRNITKETFSDFKERVLNTFQETDISYINSLIDSFPKRIDAIITRKGGRTKY